MRLRRALPLGLLMGAIAFAGCGDDDDDDPSGPNISQFAGNWNATSITYSSNTGGRVLNIVPLGGALNLNIASTGTFTGSITIPGVGTVPLTGDVSLQGTNQANVDFDWPAGVTPPIDDFTATYSLSGNSLTFTRQNANFQFPGQPTAELTSVVIIMTRS